MIEPFHRRHALQIASQLPDNLADALAVLEAAREIITHVHGGNGGGERVVIALVPREAAP